MIRITQTTQLPSASASTHMHLWPRVSALLAEHGPLRLCAVQILARLFVDAADLLVASQPSEQAFAVCAKWVEVIDESSTPSSVCRNKNN